MLTIVLAKIIGWYLLLIGFIFLIRRKTMMSVVSDLIKNRPLVYIVCILELVAGLSLVSVHNLWSTGLEMVVSLVGWLMLFEALFYLLMPYRRIEKVVRQFNRPTWYISSGVIAIIFGAYLVNFAFGWF